LNLTLGKYLRFKRKLLAYNKSNKRHLYPILEQRALVETAIYCEEYLQNAQYLTKRNDIFDYAASLLSNTIQISYVVEFGVWKGESINYLAKRISNSQIYGFDTFYGLPENWAGTHTPKGYFSVNGVQPKVEDNVHLTTGLFDEVTEKTLRRSKIPYLSLIHIDCDLYSSTKQALESVGQYIYKDVLIIFDEFFGYPNWKNGEFKAFTEFSKNNSLNFEFLAFSTRQVLIKIL